VAFGDLPAAIGQSGGLDAPSFSLGTLAGRTCPLNHPQGGVGLRLEEDGRALVFLTDNELAAPGPSRYEDFVRFCAGAAVLVHDAQYLPEELAQRAGWGHSDWAGAVELARRAGVERLILTHHDPDRGDGQIDDLLAATRAAAPPGLRVDAAGEGLSLEI
jgi:ribonuclease BN (tRNA processing enzyme)